jgi:putative endonuclease
MIWPWKKAVPLGQRGEDLACRFLRKQGFKILDRNVRLARCEIDIIAREDDTVAFIEVKTRRRADGYQPEDSVGRLKQRHIHRAAGIYSQRMKDTQVYLRFDIVSITLPDGEPPEIRLIRNAF